MLTALHDEITAKKVTADGLELSNFNREYYLLCLIDGDGKTKTLGIMPTVSVWVVGVAPGRRSTGQLSKSNYGMQRQ